MTELPNLKIVARNEQPKSRRPTPFPDYKRIHTTIVGSNGGACPWGKVGPFILSEAEFHELAALARRLADDGGRL
jgi:hypothetical protein